jgi:hypothetical protein
MMAGGFHVGSTGLGAHAGTLFPLAVEIGERIHFQIIRSSYLDDVSKLPFSDEPRFAQWRWGGLALQRGVVYDESDEILLKEQSSAWKKRVQITQVGACGARGVAALGDHYLVLIGC